MGHPSGWGARVTAQQAVNTVQGSSGFTVRDGEAPEKQRSQFDVGPRGFEAWPRAASGALGSPLAQQRRMYPAAADGYRSRFGGAPGPAVFLLVQPNEFVSSHD